MSARARGQNRRAIAASTSRPRRARAVKTRGRAREGAGGRPLLFIPAAVVERARALYSGRAFSSVVRLLEGEGNGTWPRRTLMRRVASTPPAPEYSRGQNPQLQELAGGRRRAARALDKTGAAAALERGPWPDYDTPAYHDRLATLHALLGGRCGCYSCGRARSSPTVRTSGKAGPLWP